MTNSDIRLQTSWYSNLKRKKLQKRLGGDGTTAFVDLLIYAAVNKPDGNLTDFTDEDIETAAQWSGDPGTLITTLRDLKFIDGEPGSYQIHDWEENNPWACGAEKRSEAARKANEIRWQRERDAERNADGIQTESEPDAGRTNPESPSPSPLPSNPSPKKKTLPPKSGGGSQSTDLFGETQKPKKKSVPIEDRKATTPVSILIRYWHRLFKKVHGTGYIGDLKKMGGQMRTALKKSDEATIQDAMEYLFALKQTKYVLHDFDHFIRKLSYYIIEKDRKENN